MLEFLPELRAKANSARETALYLLTNGGADARDLSIGCLGMFDRAAFEVLERQCDLAVSMDPSRCEPCLALYVNSLGRLYIRPASDSRASCGADGPYLEAGFVVLNAAILAEIEVAYARAQARERKEFGSLKDSLDRLRGTTSIEDIVEQVIDHVQHVESVAFYVGDRFLARVDTFRNLIDPPNGTGGFLNRLRVTPYPQWSEDEILVVAALHALFLSGKSVRFEEFNGLCLTATALWAKLHSLLRAYRDAGCEYDCHEVSDLFALAQIVRGLSLKSTGSDWLRYRTVYGLTFRKNERVLCSPKSSEEPHVYLDEFGELSRELTGHCPGSREGEDDFFRKLCQASLQRDLKGRPSADTGADTCLERLIEEIVISAVMTTKSDYGMSSALRNIEVLMKHDEPDLLRAVHALVPPDFFTCFVSVGFGTSLDKELADAIALSVQRRMMFNRWHFIPGNLERPCIEPGRHWYYPPVIPDIAIHSDVHRAAHARAQVKYSIRAPGPDMSAKPLVMAGRPYRGFYDVRVVRMAGSEFTTEDMLRVRRRTMWMAQVYAAIVDHVNSGNSFRITGFAPGRYRDIARWSRDNIDEKGHFTTHD